MTTEFSNTRKQMASLLAKYKITGKASWKAFLLHHHPDKGGDAEIFVAVKNAYELIKPVESKLVPQNISKDDEYIRAGFRPPKYKCDMQCTVITKKGTQCTRCVIYPLNVCMQHEKK